MEILFLFAILDMNINFDYQDPVDNQYYQETCKHHEFLNLLLNAIARYHGYEKLK